jgi:hypothetical protein
MSKHKAVCVDRSGSMPRGAVEMARGIAGPDDVVIMFDSAAWVDDFSRRESGRGGGTDARTAVDLAHRLGFTHLVLVSDGEMPKEHIDLFDEFVHVADLSPSSEVRIPGPYSGT